MLETIDDLIFNQLIISIIGVFVGAIGGAIGGYFTAQIRKHKKAEDDKEKRNQAWTIILKATARRLIFDAYDDYVIQKKHLTVDRFREISETYEAYVTCGGNGTAKKYYEEISKINPYLVTD